MGACIKCLTHKSYAYTHGLCALWKRCDKITTKRNDWPIRPNHFWNAKRKNDLSEDSHCTDNNWKKNQVKAYQKTSNWLRSVRRECKIKLREEITPDRDCEKIVSKWREKVSWVAHTYTRASKQWVARKTHTIHTKTETNQTKRERGKKN